MRAKGLSVVAVLAMAGAGASARAASDAAAKHAAIGAYEGTKTCAACHARQVDDFVKSLHYQQQGPAPFLANAQQGKSAGMMVSY